jgi:hypothetical protein
VDKGVVAALFLLNHFALQFQALALGKESFGYAFHFKGELIAKGWIEIGYSKNASGHNIVSINCLAKLRPRQSFALNS